MKENISGTLPEQDLLTPKEIADYLRVKERTVNKYISDGKIPPDVLRRIGKTVRFIRIKFLEWLFHDGDSEDLTNVTELNQTEEALRESEERFRFLTRASIDAIVQIDNEGKFIFINDAVTRMFGYQEKDVINKHFTEHVVEVDLLKGREMFQKCLAGESVMGELRCFHKSGHKVLILFTGTPVMKNGQLSSIVGILRDNTHKKQTEAALIKTEERYRALRVFGCLRDDMLRPFTQGDLDGKGVLQINRRKVSNNALDA